MPPSLRERAGTWGCVSSSLTFVMNFTNDEMNLVCIYDTGNRTGLINALSEMRKELSMDETDLRELTDSTLNKLSAMSDEDYAKLELYPDFDE